MLMFAKQKFNGQSSLRPLFFAALLWSLSLNIGWSADGLEPEERAIAGQSRKGPAAKVAVKYEDKMEHWAFKAPVRPAEPKVKNKKWVRNPIDSFVLSRLEKQKLAPSPEA